ncbi:extracellular solute-binding protein [Vibrio tapetis subsp. quintayensis]|uniref:extracellular solute-binding protein n=1 Tax=Vibrio tapetis TaxID=52443 RepID=UPI0025B614CE|nr:extracellular solute-binding protein [Vibrio tapetis]MDN3682930.1 extracellular solute-binding protein [Vibrio tapetis subsp. quintayensis]
MLKKWTIAFALTLQCSTGVAANVIDTDRIVGFGDAKYPSGFTHFDFVKADAPKGGSVTYGTIGTFDNFNRYASRGNPGSGVGKINDPLFYTSPDDIDVSYALIAKIVRYSDDFTWLEVDLNQNAKFHDGVPILAKDVEFTFAKFMAEGVPQFKTYYKDVKSVKATSERTVRVDMTTPNREKLLAVLRNIPILPEHFWKDKSLADPLSQPPLGSGPYVVSNFKSGQSITYSRVEDYWAKDLPVNVGRNNFDTVTYDYYRDDTVMLEAFKAGEFDIRQEGVAKFWATAYNGVNFDKGYIKKEEIDHSIPQSMQGFVFNIQRPIFNDPKVREALTYALDFEWMNKNMFYGQYTRTQSYFQNSDYQASDLPSSEEVKWLAPIKDQIPPRVYTQAYQAPVADGSGRIRKQMRTAFKLLKDAGWELKNKVMTNVETGEVMSFELLIYSPTTERFAIPVQKNLKQMGIEMKIRTIDTTQYLKRYQDRDYDMVFASITSDKYPSTSLQIVWNSRYIDSTYNRPGVQDPAVDYLTDKIAENQENPEALLHLGKALDRVLIWNFYAIPAWHNSQYRVASWDKFSRPEHRPTYDLGLDTWWVDTEKASKLPENRR